MSTKAWGRGRYDTSTLQRREERHVKDEVRERPKAKRKDTKKWCKGIDGRAHAPIWQPGKSHYPPFKTTHLDFTCDACGKVLATYWRSKDYEHPTIGSNQPLQRRKP
jgi:hypothetical protein